MSDTDPDDEILAQLYAEKEDLARRMLKVDNLIARRERTLKGEQPKPKKGKKPWLKVIPGAAVLGGAVGEHKAATSIAGAAIVSGALIAALLSPWDGNGNRPGDPDRPPMAIGKMPDREPDGRGAEQGPPAPAPQDGAPVFPQSVEFDMAIDDEPSEIPDDPDFAPMPPEPMEPPGGRDGAPPPSGGNGDGDDDGVPPDVDVPPDDDEPNGDGGPDCAVEVAASLRLGVEVDAQVCIL